MIFPVIINLQIIHGTRDTLPLRFRFASTDVSIYALFNAIERVIKSHVLGNVRRRETRKDACKNHTLGSTEYTVIRVYYLNTHKPQEVYVQLARTF